MSEPMTAAEANRQFYAKYATTYDEDECCATGTRERDWLRGRLRLALSHLPNRPLRALDAGGGTGNGASILVELGIEPVVLDISPEMLARWRAKRAATGSEAITVNEPIEHFLVRDDTSWDFVLFSSVLHHLEDPAEALRLAAARLAPGGLILTVQDPLPADRLSRLIRRLDWGTYAMFHYRWALLASMIAKLRRTLPGGSDAVHIGRLAERHALEGLDIDPLARALRLAGLEIVQVDLQASARYQAIRAALRVLRRNSNFSIIARRPISPIREVD